MIRTGLAENISTGIHVIMVAGLANFELLSAALSFAGVVVVLIVSVVAGLAEPCCSGAGRHSLPENCDGVFDGYIR